MDVTEVRYRRRHNRDELEFEDDDDDDDENSNSNSVVADELNSDDYDNFVVEDEASGASDFDNYGENVSGTLGNVMRSSPFGSSRINCTSDSTSDEGCCSEDDVDSDGDVNYGGGPNRRRYMAEMIDNGSGASSVPPIFNDKKRVPTSKLSIQSSVVHRPRNSSRPRTSVPSPSSPSSFTSSTTMNASYAPLQEASQHLSTSTSKAHSPAHKGTVDALSRKRRVFWVERTEFTGGDHRPCFTFHGAVVEINQSAAPTSTSTTTSSTMTEQRTLSSTQSSHQRLLEKGLTLSVRYEPPSPKFSHKCPSSASYRLKVARGKDFLYSTRGMEKSLLVDYSAHHAVWGDLELHFVQQAEMRRFMIRLKHVKQEDVTGKGILLGDYHMPGIGDNNVANVEVIQDQDAHTSIVPILKSRLEESYQFVHGWSRSVWIKTTTSLQIYLGKSLFLSSFSSTSSSNNTQDSPCQKMSSSIGEDEVSSYIAQSTSSTALKIGISISIGVGILATISCLTLKRR